MPHRTVNLVLGILGVLAVAVLVVIGRDLARSLHTGPRWKRRLIAAGVFLLSLGGVSVGAASAAEKVPPPQAVETKKGASEQPDISKELRKVSSQMAKIRSFLDAGSTDAKTAQKLIQALQPSLAVLKNDKQLAKLPPRRQDSVKYTVKQANYLITTLRLVVAVELNVLAKAPQWPAVVQYWKMSKPLADSGKSTSAQRKESDNNLAAAKKALEQLKKAKLLSAAEASLLVSNADQIRQDIYRNPPTDFKGTCYLMAPPISAHMSLRRLEKRLPLLKQLAAAGRISPAVVEKVTDSIEKDIITLSDEKLTKPLKPAELNKAAKLRAEAAEILRLVETRVAAARMHATPQWKKIQAYRQAAAKLNPQSSKEEKVRIKQQYAAANNAADELIKIGILTAADAKRLKAEVQRLDKLANIKTEVTRPTCYMPPPPKRPRERSEVLPRQLPALARQAKAGRISPVVLMKLLPALSDAAADIDDPARRAQAEATIKSLARYAEDSA